MEDRRKYFGKLFRDREGTDLSVSDSNRKHIQDLYKKARIKSLQNLYLGEAKSAIHDAKQARAESLVPNTFQQARRSYKNAEAFINANSLDISSIEQHANKATTDAKRLLRVTRAAASLKSATPEQEAVALDKAQQRNQRLAGALDQQAFEQKFEEARQMFNSQEAEVYKQGDQLLIRLKGIAFPTASASLPPASYPLISKVGNVIKTFDNQTTRVRIEGHTDSTGGKQFNQELSQKRAEAVKTYLTSNSGLKADQIEVVGMGYSRPLASNKSAEGRAQNRRVDVIVMPQVQESEQIRQAQ